MSHGSSNIQLLYDLSQFLSDYFNLEEIRTLCFELGVNYENLPGDTRSRKARELIIHLGDEDDNARCQARYQELLLILKENRSAFYPSLFEHLDQDAPETDGEFPEAELAQKYCEARTEFIQATKPLHEKALGRIGLENRVGTIIIVLILAAFALASYLLWRQVRPEQMGGDFNIAVAPFYVVGEEAEIGQDVANSIYGRLQSNFGESVLPIVEVWGPDEPLLNPVPVVRGETDDVRDANAARLADEINADIVVYGVVVKNESGWIVTPKFYISPNNFENASEILGPYDLGQTFSLAEGNRRALRITAGDELTPRAEFLTQVAIGLTYYSIANYDRAEDTLLNILPAKDSSMDANDESLRLVYLLLGNTMLKQALQQVATIDSSNAASVELAESKIALFLQEAEAYFSQSAEIDSEYSRAFVGLGDTAYQQSFKCDAAGCSIDEALLNEAIAYYEQALVAENSPETAVIDAKANFGLGQVYLQQSRLNNVTDFAQAKTHFEAVIADYQAENPPRSLARSRDIVAEAQARLGLIYCFQGQIDEAIDHYKEAVRLHTNDPLQEANRLLSGEVREQRIELYERRILVLESSDTPSCTGGP